MRSKQDRVQGRRRLDPEEARKESSPVKFGVITSVPPVTEAGNMAASFGDVFVEVEPMTPQNGYKGVIVPVTDIIGATAITLRSPVFQLGEILVLDDDGREIGGMRRKPGKWDVGCDHFATVEEAIAAAKEVQS